MSTEVSIAETARHFGVTTQTVRRWIVAGCPCVAPGEVGRGRGARLDLAVVERWRKHSDQNAPSDPDEIMLKVETALFDVVRRDGGNGMSIAQELGVPVEVAAEILTHARNRIARALGLKCNTDV